MVIGKVFGQLLNGDEPEVYADKAYGSEKNRKALRGNNIVDKVIFKAVRNKPQPRWQTDLNKLLGKSQGWNREDLWPLEDYHGNRQKPLSWMVPPPSAL